MQSLVDKSLLRHNEDRFWMLETIREHADEHLESSGEADELRGRHAAYYLELAEEAHPEVREVEFQGTGPIVDVLERDHDNLRAALDCLTARGETQQVLQLAGALAEFWFRADYWTELRVRLLQAIDADARPTPARARALVSASDVVALYGDLEQARGLAEESLTLNRERGDLRGVADAVLRIGASFQEQGDPESAQPFFEEARALYGEVDDQSALLSATRMLAWSLEQAGELERAKTFYAENLERSRAIGNPLIYSASLGWLATLAADEGRFDEAFASAHEHLPIARTLGNVETATALMRVARVLSSAGQSIYATQVLAAADAMFEEIGIADTFWAVAQVRKLQATLREAMDGAELAAAWEEGRARTPDEAVAFALNALA